jgi:hypothetical protein
MKQNREELNEIMTQNEITIQNNKERIQSKEFNPKKYRNIMKDKLM